MLLTVDVGNSQTVLATFDGDRRVGCWRVTTAPRATADELRLLWRGLLRDAEITGVAACSTVPALLPALRQLLDSLEVPVVLIGPGVRTGVPLHVDNPREVGADRVVTALAAHELFGRGPTGGAGRSSSSTSARRRTSTPSGPTGSSSAARWPPAWRSAWTRWPPAPRSSARSSSPFRRTRSGRTPSPRCSRAWSSGSPAWSTAWSTRIAAEIVAPVRRRAGRRRDRGLAPLVVDSCRSIAEREPDLTVHGLRLAFERQQPRSPDRAPTASP